MNAIPQDAPLVRITDLHKGYGAHIKVLRGLNIEMKPGERVVVIGPSGGGKSTLLRVVMGLEEIQQGAVTFAGQPYIRAEGRKTRIDTEQRKKIGMVFQHYTLFPHLSILQNLTLAPRKVNGEAKASAEARGRAILARFGLEAKADAYPSQLSGGQKERVAIARAAWWSRMARPNRFWATPRRSARANLSTVSSISRGEPWITHWI